LERSITLGHFTPYSNRESNLNNSECPLEWVYSTPTPFCPRTKVLCVSAAIQSRRITVGLLSSGQIFDPKHLTTYLSILSRNLFSKQSTRCLDGVGAPEPGLLSAVGRVLGLARVRVLELVRGAVRAAARRVGRVCEACSILVVRRHLQVPE